jgi:hypothetical protein
MDERILDHLKRLNRIIQDNVEDFKLFQDKIVEKLNAQKT